MAFNFLIQLAVSTAFFVIGELLRPKPEFEDAEAVPYEDAGIPSNDPSKKIPVIWGKVDLYSPHVMDYVYYYQKPIKKKVSTGLFSSTSIIVGYRYFVGVQLGICDEIGDIHKIWIDDRSLPFATKTDEGDDGYKITVNKPEFLGGEENGGGIVGTIRVYKGTSTQNANSYLGKYRTDNPTYAFTSHAVLQNVEVGENPNISNWGFQVSRYPDPLGLGSNNTIGDDINPMTVVYELLTKADYGFSINASSITTSTFTASGATLKTEGNGMSLKWINNESVERLIDSINKQVNGVLRFNPTTGKWEYKLVREDYVLGNLKVLDESNIIELASFNRASWDETINQVELNFNQRNSKEKPSPALAHDQSNYIRQQRQKIMSLTFPGVYNETLAQKLAARELKIAAFPLSTTEFTVDRYAFGLLPGDAFIFAWGELGLTQLVMRVGDIGFGSDDQMSLSISAVEDVFAGATATFTSAPSTGWTEIITSPAALVYHRVQDTPYIFAAQDTEYQGATIEDQAMTLAAAPQANSLSYDIKARQGTDPFVVEGSASFVTTGTLQSLITESQGDELATLVVLNVTDANLLSATAVSDADIQERQQNLIIVISTENDPYTQFSRTKYEPEIMAYDSLTVGADGTTVTLAGVHRGMADTMNAKHAAGDRVWFLTGANLIGPGRSSTLLEASGESVDIRLQPIATTGVGAETGTTALTGRVRVDKPYPAGNFKINSARYPTGLISVGGNISMTWKHRNKISLVLHYQDEATSYGFSTTVPEEGFEYRLDIYDESGVAGNAHVRRVVASGSSIGIGTASFLGNFTANNDSYNYTNAIQTSDGGPYSKYRVELRVTNSAGTIVNLIDVIRIVSVDLPLDLLTRGKIFQGIFDWSPTMYLTTAETSGDLVDVTGTSSDWTVTGTIGYNLPGPDRNSRALFFPATAGVYASIGDEAWNDISTSSTCVVFSFWIRVNEVDATYNTPIFAGMPSATNMEPNSGGQYICFLDTTGRLRTIHRPSSTNYTSTPISSNVAIDDGKWHHVVIWWANGGMTFVDGHAYARMATGGNNTASTVGIFLGGHNDTTSNYRGLADMEISNFAFWKTSSFNGGPTDPTDSDNFSRWLHDNWHTPMLEKSPYLRAVQGSGAFKHHELGNVLLTSNGADPPIFPRLSGGLAFNNFTSQQWKNTANTDGFLAGPFKNQFSRAVQNLNFDGFYELADSTSSAAGFANGEWNNNGGVADTDASFSCWVYVHSHNATRRVILALASTGTGQRRHGLGINTSDALMFYSMWNCSNGTLNNGYIETCDYALPTGVWLHVGFSILEQNRASLFINGVKVASTATTYGGGGGTYTYEWIRSSGTSLLVPSLLNCEAIRGGGDSWQRAIAAVAHATMWNDAVPDSYFASLYAAGMDDELTVLDMLRSDNPQHVFMLEDSTDAADQFDNLANGEPTATGTFLTNTIGLEATLTTQSGELASPVGFNGGERLEYDFPLLGNKSTGDLDDVTFVIAARNMDLSGSGVFTIAMNNYSNAGEASSDGNQIFETDNVDDSIMWRASPVSAGSTIYETTANSFDFGNHDLFVFRESGSAGSKTATIFKRGAVEYTLGGDQNEYNGSAVDRFLVGNRNTGANQLFYGTVGYIAAYDRAISSTLARRLSMKYAGLGAYEIAVLQHDIQFLFMCDESEWTAPNVLFNSSLYPNKDIAINGTPIKDAFDAGPTGVKLAALKFVQADSEEAVGVNTTIASSQYPYVIGGWFRCNAADDDAFISLSDSAGSNYISVGIFSDAPGAVITGTTLTSGTVTNGDWVHVVFVIASASSHFLYVNGEFVTQFTTTVTMPTSFDATGINGRSLSAGTTLADGSYAGVFFGSSINFGTSNVWRAQCIMEIYCASVGDGYSAAVQSHADVLMLYRLNEFWDDQLAFHDAINRAKVAVGTGMTQGAIGIIPQHKSLCVDFDGAGNIDTNRVDYPASTADRVFEFWAEVGYTGVVCSMGANTDAQSFTIGIASSGNVFVHLRGSGNEREFSGAAGSGARHIAIEVLGDSLHDVNCYINGVLATVSTAGTDTTLATTATENLVLGTQHANLTTLPASAQYGDGNGKLQGFAAYDAAWGTTTTESARVALQHYTLGTS